MKVLNLEIKRPNSYSPEEGILQGLLTLKSSSGQQSITLTASTINKIFRLVAKEAGITAIQNASKVEIATNNAGEEAILTETDGELLTEG